MQGIHFDYRSPAPDLNPDRMDVACFTGFAAQNPNASVPPSVQTWWKTRGWTAPGQGGLTCRPVPIDSWDSFQSLFSPYRPSHRARVKGQALSDPLTLTGETAWLHLILDGRSARIELGPHPAVPGSFSLSLSELESRLNLKLGMVFPGKIKARLRPESTGACLVLERTLTLDAGELTVSANPVLGFVRGGQDDHGLTDTYMAAAVRAFFRQGGRNCYVISMGPPLEYTAKETCRAKKILELIWGRNFARKILSQTPGLDLPGLARVMAWAVHGTGSGLGPGLDRAMAIDDLTYLCFPDLADLCRDQVDDFPEEVTYDVPEVFVPCSSRGEGVPENRKGRAMGLPGHSITGYGIWKSLIRHILFALAKKAPDVQLVAGLPLGGTGLGRSFEDYVLSELLPGGDRDEDRLYRRLQLAFPWVKTGEAGNLVQGAEPPEGSLLGILARKAIVSGAHISVAGTRVDRAHDLWPRNLRDGQGGAETGEGLARRISWLAVTPRGIRLTSDVTAAEGKAHQYAMVRRIMILVHRAAARVGRNHVFEPNNRATWASVKKSFSDLLMDLYRKNALWGKTPDQAFSVACGPSNMTARDMDGGRCIVDIVLQPALPVEQIRIHMVLETRGKKVTA